MLEIRAKYIKVFEEEKENAHLLEKEINEFATKRAIKDIEIYTTKKKVGAIVGYTHKGLI